MGKRMKKDLKHHLKTEDRAFHVEVGQNNYFFMCFFILVFILVFICHMICHVFLFHFLF